MFDAKAVVSRRNAQADPGLFERTIVINTAESVIEALDIESRYNISFWDALIVQAAGSSGATVVYSEDLAHGQSYGSVRVVNPLNGLSSE